MNHPINVSRRSTKALLLLPLLFSTATARPVQADTPIATIHQFGNPDPGVMAPPIRATDGNFYGTIEDGGGSNLYRTGRVYKMTPAGVYSILYPFSGLTDGGDLIGGIIQGRDGNLYGTTAFGGLFGNGTVYKLTLDGKLTTLHSFSGPDGINPAATLTQAADGYFYGTTNLGGSSNDGTVFRISTSGAFLTVHQFDGTNGSFPDSKLAVGRDGNLYGTTDIDGGVAPMFYSISPAGAFHVLNSNLWIKGGVIQGGDGNFYGVGPNALYSITPSGAATALTTYGGDWTLSAYIDGGDGNLYGTSSITTTTADGTTTDSYIDAISSTGVHYGFARSSNPVSSVVAATSTGWIVDEPTTLNSIDYASNDTAIGTKVLSADAATPSQIVQIADGTIWGISYNRWVYGATGSLFSMTSDGRSKFVRTYAYFSMPSNPSDTGYDPNPFNLLGIDGRGSLWGATSQSLAQIDPSGSVNYLPTDFLGCNKMIAGPNGDLYAAVGNYSASGAIVKIDANGTITTVHGFSGPDGAYPSSVLYASDGNFYGVTKQGGANNDGEVFKMTPQGDVTVVYSFTSAIFPSELIEGHDGRLYGISRNGGDVYEVTLVGQQLTGGTAFAITKTGGGFTTLHAFGIPDGIVPTCLMRGPDGLIYGTAEQEPSIYYSSDDYAGKYGVIFRIDLKGVYSVIHTFRGFDGSCPIDLLKGLDGNLYGITKYGSVLSFMDGQYFNVGPGTLFKVETAGLPAPKNSTAKPGDKNIFLSWSPTVGAAGYNVYRGTSPGAESSTAITSVPSVSPQDPLAPIYWYDDQNLTNGTKYYYKITAFNDAGESPKSTEVSATPVAASTTFVGIDTNNHGNWKGKYGGDGWNVIGDPSTQTPAYATVTPGAHNTGIWAAASLAPGALQAAPAGSAKRLAGVWYNTSWSMNVKMTGTHQIALYLLDLNNAGYAETITVKDAATGIVLDTRTASSFGAGVYYVWNITGNVNITLTSTAGHWAVVSGIFFGPGSGTTAPSAPTGLKATPSSQSAILTWSTSTGATSYAIYRGSTSGGESTTPIATGITATTYTSTGLTPGSTYYYKIVAVNAAGGSFASTELSTTTLLPTSTATFVTADTSTQGNWKGIYGIDGYNVIGDTSGPNPAYPAYATVTAGSHTTGVWSSTSTDPKCLQKVATSSTTRMAGVWYNTTWSMNVNVTGTHKLALYLLDYPNSGYAETITIKDAATGVVLDTRSAASFQNGVYEVWNVSGNVTVTMTSTAGHWAPLSGIFFG